MVGARLITLRLTPICRLTRHLPLATWVSGIASLGRSPRKRGANTLALRVMAIFMMIGTPPLQEA
jgi:hypothetical protein